MNQNSNTPTVLLILDGWGHREETRDNAIANGHTPVWDRLWKNAPHTLISTSGLDVGLPDGQMGNSEVGHMSLGAGRVVFQSITRIDQAIADGSFHSNPAYNQAIDKALAVDGAVHIMGLLSPGGVHSHQNQIIAAIELAAARGVKKIYLHAFLDGRDTPPRSAADFLSAIDSVFQTLGCGRIASMIGRYYAMDRDNRWDRVERAYQLLTQAKADYRFGSAQDALQGAYDRDENDEFVSASVIQADGQEQAVIGDGDTVLFMNFRADRARQLSRAFVDTDFPHFTRTALPQLSDFVMTTEYAASIKTSCAFPPNSLDNVLGDYLAQLGKTQLRIAETEKYAHVTFFFSGGREDPFDGEERIMIPSPDVATYDLKPEMSAPELTDKLVEAIHSGRFDLIVCNYANGDMVGHTGNFQAAVKAVEALDECLGRIEGALLAVGGQALVTADHGNCEQMMDYVSGQVHTQHTTEQVPLVFIGERLATLNSAGGKLADIAPTLLAMMGLPQPTQMTGSSLIELGP